MLPPFSANRLYLSICTPPPYSASPPVITPPVTVFSPPSSSAHTPSLPTVNVCARLSVLVSFTVRSPSRSTLNTLPLPVICST